MSTTYVENVLTNKKYRGNVVIKIGDTYFSTSPPDSGLTIPAPYNRSVVSLTLNPTTIDPKRVTTTISSYSFRLLDKNEIITQLVLGDARNLIGSAVEIWVGRVGLDMDFANYFKLPITYLNKSEHPDSTYTFSATEQTERMAKPIYSTQSALAVDITSGTTEWTMRDGLTGFAASGFLKVDDEFVSYTGIDLINNRFQNVIRGELGSIPVEHSKNTDVFIVETVVDNPLNILLKILVSGGGGGVYDVLQSGLAISESLIDVSGIENLRDTIFSDRQFSLLLSDIDSALKFIENQILLPNGLRFTYSLDSKLSLATLDRAIFVDEDNVIDENTITKFPKWAIDGTKVTNQITVQWDYDEGTNMYNQKTVYSDQDSIDTYGLQKLDAKFDGIKADLDGQNLVDDFAQRLLERLKTPTPTISVTTQIDKSLQNVGDKAYLVSSKIPSAVGTLDFASDLEIISRSINQTNGDVQFTLAFTSFTNIRSAFIAPSDLITSFVNQRKINIAGGRAQQYRVGWFMRLWDQTNQVYMPDPPNEITELVEASKYLVTEDGNDRFITEEGDFFVTEDEADEDTLIFANDWVTDLASGDYRIRFAGYDEAVTSQHRYCFISDNGNNFPDGKPTYRITF